jgi:hypothetical protein
VRTVWGIIREGGAIVKHRIVLIAHMFVHAIAKSRSPSPAIIHDLNDADRTVIAVEYDEEKRW